MVIHAAESFPVVLERIQLSRRRRNQSPTDHVRLDVIIDARGRRSVGASIAGRADCRVVADVIVAAGRNRLDGPLLGGRFKLVRVWSRRWRSSSREQQRWPDGDRLAGNPLGLRRPEELPVRATELVSLFGCLSLLRRLLLGRRLRNWWLSDRRLLAPLIITRRFGCPGRWSQVFRRSFSQRMRLERQLRRRNHLGRLDLRLGLRHCRRRRRLCLLSSCRRCWRRRPCQNHLIIRSTGQSDLVSWPRMNVTGGRGVLVLLLLRLLLLRRPRPRRLLLRRSRRLVRLRLFLNSGAVSWFRCWRTELLLYLSCWALLNGSRVVIRLDTRRRARSGAGQEVTGRPKGVGVIFGQTEQRTRFERRSGSLRPDGLLNFGNALLMESLEWMFQFLFRRLLVLLGTQISGSSRLVIDVQLGAPGDIVEEIGILGQKEPVVDGHILGEFRKWILVASAIFLFGDGPNSCCCCSCRRRHPLSHWTSRFFWPNAGRRRERAERRIGERKWSVPESTEFRHSRRLEGRIARGRQRNVPRRPFLERWAEGGRALLESGERWRWRRFRQRRRLRLRLQAAILLRTTHCNHTN